MSDIRAKVLPIYFVADESGSMADVVGELNDGLTALLDALHEESLAASMVRFSILGFSDNIIEHLSLADLRSVRVMPRLDAYDLTSYRSIFVDLRHRIDSDINQLRDDGLLVHRPVVFFLSDGIPNKDNEDWETSLDDLRDEHFKYHPTILAFGIGDAVPQVIRRVATDDRSAFIAAKGVDTGAALTEFLKALTQSIVTSGQLLSQGKSELPFKKPDQFVLAIDVLPE